jgi:predicted nucleic acid-binding Zn ribbon protein
MSLLFDKRTKKTVRIIWSILGVLIILSMALFFAPGLIPGVGY